MGHTPQIDLPLETIDQAIRAHRAAKDWTIGDLAQKADVTAKTIQRIESGESIGMEKLRAIAQALGALAILQLPLPTQGTPQK